MNSRRLEHIILVSFSLFGVCDLFGCFISFRVLNETACCMIPLFRAYAKKRKPCSSIFPPGIYMCMCDYVCMCFCVHASADFRRSTLDLNQLKLEELETVGRCRDACSYEGEYHETTKEKLIFHLKMKRKNKKLYFA